MSLWTLKYLSGSRWACSWGILAFPRQWIVSKLSVLFGDKRILAILSLIVGILLLSISGVKAEELYQQPYYKSASYINAYCQTVRYYNNRLSEKQVQSIVKAILYYSHCYGLDPRLVVAVIACESHFQPGAVSSAGAVGLGQLMPGTARQEGVDPHNAVLNIHGTCRVLCQNLKHYGDNGEYQHSGYSQGLELALAAYNAGSGAVDKYGGVPPYRETIDYVGKVLSEYRRLCGMQ